MEILKVENLYKIYGKGNNQVQALNDISFSVEKVSLLRLSDSPVPANLRCCI